MKLLYSGPDVECLFLPGQSDWLLVTFNEMMMAASGSDIWGGRLAARLGLNTIGFMTRRPNWFPRRDMDRAIDAAVSFLGNSFPERLGYGYSQGAYGALKYGAALRLSRALAFSPQYSINPVVVPNCRFAKFFDPVMHENMEIAATDCAPRNCVFHDPYDGEDRRHIDLFPAVERIAVPWVGHNSVRPFANTSAIEGLFAACRDDDTPLLRQLSATARRRYKQRASTVALLAHRRHVGRIARIIEAHRHVIPQRQMVTVCQRMARLGRAEDAERWARDATQNAG